MTLEHAREGSLSAQGSNRQGPQQTAVVRNTLSIEKQLGLVSGSVRLKQREVSIASRVPGARAGARMCVVFHTSCIHTEYIRSVIRSSVLSGRSKLVVWCAQRLRSMMLLHAACVRHSINPAQPGTCGTGVLLPYNSSARCDHGLGGGGKATLFLATPS